MPPRRTKQPGTTPPIEQENQPRTPPAAVEEVQTINGGTQTPKVPQPVNKSDNAGHALDMADLDEEADMDTDGFVKATPKSKPSYAGGYDALKSFNGQVYKGMAIGGSHTWNYDPGIWKETKVEPDLWQVDFKTKKRRAKNAPSGSGAPVGTEYHWLIVSHQYVKKIDANTYETHLVGSKYKLAHKNANSNSWSINTVKAQRDRELELLDDAKRRVQGLPPVIAGEKVKVEKHEKGQKSLDQMFGQKLGGDSNTKVGGKRKREM